MAFHDAGAATPIRQTEPATDEIRRCVEKIVANPIFSASERMTRFLRFAVDHALQNRGDRLKEYTVGVEIFDRDPSFDPRIDPLVRVEARRLRSKLQAYYAAEGKDDPVVIEFPRGTYTPVFHRPESVQPGYTQPAAANIAVLPFSNLSSDPRNEYFSDGLTEELIHALMRIRGLFVVAWNSASQMKGREQDLAGIRDLLNVKYLLRGSVRRDSGRVRITAQLIEVATGRYLWSEAYDRPLGDLFAIEEQIARQIVQSLSLQLAPAESTITSARGPANLKCYNLCLKGRFHSDKRTPEGFKRALRCFEDAISIQPCSRAYAGIADVHLLLAEHGLTQPKKSMQRARIAAMKALDFDPLSAEAYTCLATIRTLFDRHWPEAEVLYRRAIEINPGYATAHHWYALDFLARLGRMEEAAVELEIAQNLDPLAAIILEGKGFLAMLCRSYDTALEQYRETLELDATFYRVYTAMGRALIQKGAYEEAIVMLEKGRSLAGEVPSLLSAMGQAHALAGRNPEARKILAGLMAISKKRYIPSTAIGLIHLCLGENKRALDWFEKACKQHEPSGSWLGVHPAYDPIRSDPRFQALVARILP